MVFVSPPIVTRSVSSFARVTDTTPGTLRRCGTCSVSYTSLNSASLSASTSIEAVKIHFPVMVMSVTPLLPIVNVG
ncbi:hypothetical protein D3C83_44810 [compost metagenome]